MSVVYRRRLAWVLGCAGAVTLLGSLGAARAVQAAENPSPQPVTTPSQPARQPFHLIADYLSPCLYVGEPFTACLRVENTTSAAAEAVLTVQCFDATGKSLSSTDEKLPVKAGGTADYKRELSLKDVAHVVFRLTSPTGLAQTVEVRFVREADAWPATERRNGWLRVSETLARTDERSSKGQGEPSSPVLVPVVERVAATGTRKFAPVKWALGIREQDQNAPVTRALLLLPGAWAKPAEKDGNAPDFGALMPEKTAQPVALGPLEPSACAPILRVLDTVLRTVAEAKEKPERVVLLLPPEDLAFATAPRVYRIVLETLLARLERLGVKQMVLAPPFKFGIPPAAMELLQTEVREAAAARGARVLETADWQAGDCWLLDLRTPGVYGQRPNAEGQKRIAQKLADLLP